MSASKAGAPALINNGRIAATGPDSRSDRQAPRIPGVFQLLVGLYILLTGSLPSIVQGLAFGVDGAAGAEFAIAMVASFARDLLILAPVLILANHPLGILHPLLLGVVVWPLLTGMPSVIQELGGWAGILAGVPVPVPYFGGLPSHAATTVWLAIAKYNALEVLALVSTYAGFWFLKGRSGARLTIPRVNSQAMRFVLIGLVAFSTLVLFALIYSRGGVGEHLASLGQGRFRALSSFGFVMFITDLGAIAVYVWIAARPDDVKSPLFLSCFGIVMAAQFISNGSRSAALDVPLMIGLIWALRKQKVPWRTAVLLAPLLFLSVGLLGAIRTSSWTGQTAGEVISNAGFSDTFANAQNEIEERRSQSAQVPIVERGFEVAGGPLLGRSYVAALVAFIPRNVWEDKPRGPDSLYAQLFLGMPKEGMAIPVTSTAEIFWNFGVIGIVVLSLIYGGLLRVAYQAFWRRYPSPIPLVFSALVVTTFKFSTRSLVDLQQHLVLLLLCQAALAIFLPRAHYASNLLKYRVPGRAVREVSSSHP